MRLHEQNWGKEAVCGWVMSQVSSRITVLSLCIAKYLSTGVYSHSTNAPGKVKTSEAARKSHLLTYCLDAPAATCHFAPLLFLIPWLDSFPAASTPLVFARQLSSTTRTTNSVSRMGHKLTVLSHWFTSALQVTKKDLKDRLWCFCWVAWWSSPPPGSE